MEKIIEATTTYVKKYMSNYDSSHDFKHILRVLHMAHHIKAEEQMSNTARSMNDDIITLACLTHDIGDRKYITPGEDAAALIRDLLISCGADETLANTVQTVALHVSYSAESKDPERVLRVIQQYPELAVVQDADRLDAIGAIGVGRCFTYNATHEMAGLGGMDAAIVHFGEKLVKVEERMKTETGRKIARQRTERVEMFRKWWWEENDACLDK